MSMLSQVASIIIQPVVAAPNSNGSISDAPRIAFVLTNILQFLLSIVGVIAIIGLVVAGTLYFFSAGDEGKVTLAKKAVIVSIIGVAIALGGLVLVNSLAEFVQ